MSGTLGNLYANVSYALQLHASDMTRLQEQAATGSQINRISDSPNTAHQVLTLNSRISTLKNYKSNLTDLISTFEFTSSTLNSMNGELTEAKRLITQISAGIYGEDNRERIADGINDHLNQLIQLANSKHVNQYIFSGADSNTVPYTVTRDSTSGEVTAVTYQGSADQRTIQTAPGVDTNAFLVGSDTLGLDERQTPIFAIENTAATLGLGTHSVTGDVWLTVTHDGTDYNLSINGGTVVDVGTVSDATNVAVTDSNGRVLYIDATSITDTGTDLIRVPGTYNVFDTLISVRDMLNNTHSLPTHQLQQALQVSIESVTDVSNHVLQGDLSIGLTTGFLYDLQESLDTMQNDASMEADSLEQADIAQIAIDLARREVLYEMSLSVAGKLMSVTLLDFIR
ncbi:flagellar hook-associated protein FlgL [Planctomycetota bacterium]